MTLSSAQLAEWKRRVSAAVLGKVTGVSGVGLPAQCITVYLEADDDAVRTAVQKAVTPLKLPVPVHFSVAGKFERQ
ncbi:MAG: hypothetical protein O3A25_18330 [Acidobacteria bacterium]|nr:hypothetical protein [Acidobacteriota bacterium]